MVSAQSSLRLLLLVVLATASVSARHAETPSPNQPLIVVSFDAFRPDYLDRQLTPHLNEIRKTGARADYMRNVFPTKTFPNHFSIATGLYAGVHGVTGNRVFDLALGRELGYSYELFHQNKEVLPIWVRTDTKAYRFHIFQLYVSLLFVDGERDARGPLGLHDVAGIRFRIRAKRQLHVHDRLQSLAAF